MYLLKVKYKMNTITNYNELYEANIWDLIYSCLIFLEAFELDNLR